MFNVSDDVTGPPTSIGTTLSGSNPRRMWEKCMANAEFRALFADRVQRHCFGNGALAPAGAARAAECARRGDRPGGDRRVRALGRLEQRQPPEP